jgi:hypothetical protein
MCRSSLAPRPFATKLCCSCRKEVVVGSQRQAPNARSLVQSQKRTSHRSSTVRQNNGTHGCSSGFRLHRRGAARLAALAQAANADKLNERNRCRHPRIHEGQSLAAKERSESHPFPSPRTSAHHRLRTQQARLVPQHPLVHQVAPVSTGSRDIKCPVAPASSSWGDDGGPIGGQHDGAPQWQSPCLNTFALLPLPRVPDVDHRHDAGYNCSQSATTSRSCNLALNGTRRVLA